MLVGNFCSVQDASKIIGCTDGRIWQLINDGTLPAQKFNGRAYLIDLAAVQAYAKSPRLVGRPRTKRPKSAEGTRRKAAN